LVGEVDHAVGEKHLRRKNLFSARLIRVDALALLGRGAEAMQRLDALESYYGESWETQIRRARLGPFLGDLTAALVAIDHALLTIPVTRPGERSLLHRTALTKVSLLVASEQQADALKFMRSALPFRLGKAAPTDAEMVALRATVTDRESLRDVRDLLLPFFSYPNKTAIAALFNYSLAARNLHEYDEALLAVQRRFIVGSRILKFAGRVSPKRVDWSQAARRALLDLRQDLSSVGVEFFLISGTLLGCVREGDILGHDKDIDVGVMSTVPIGQAKAALSGTGRFITLPLVTERLLRVKHANGVMIDVFFHWEENGKLYHEGQKTRWWNTPFDSLECEFLGAKFQIPANFDLYLTENYGEWRTPVTDFETFCDTPNMEVANSSELLWYYHKALLDHYHKGSAVQFERVWQRIKGISKPSAEFRIAVEAAQRNIRAHLAGRDASDAV